jgi:aspartyl-tRNA(Asn)/glutamyl-tRNA(Gln) amidotransferase subunit A
VTGGASPSELPRSIGELGKLLRSRAISAVEITRRALEAAAGTQTQLNSFIAITDELAMTQAADIDALLASGRDLGPLMGVPVGVKDVFDLEGIPTTAGSRIFAGRTAATTAPAVTRLLRSGAVVVGKTNMDQFAFGPHQDDFGRTNCPADTARYAGGSSGGSAAAVASGCVLAALGSDAGGSTRFPAACCGVVGFKPTFGRVPTAGVSPTFPSLDHVGEITQSTDDLRTVFAAIADPPRGTLEPISRPPRLAVLRQWQQDCTATVVAAIETALVTLAADGADLIEDREVAGLEDSLQALVTTVGPEALLALEPYAEAVPPALAEILASARQQHTIEYLTAQQDRGALRAAVDDALAHVDALVMPTSLDVAWLWADIDSSDMGLRNVSTRNLPLPNLTGHPAISIPAPSPGLPVGLQLIGRTGQDEQLLEIASWAERSLVR